MFGRLIPNYVVVDLLDLAAISPSNYSFRLKKKNVNVVLDIQKEGKLMTRTPLIIRLDRSKLTYSKTITSLIIGQLDLDRPIWAK